MSSDWMPNSRSVRLTGTNGSMRTQSVLQMTNYTTSYRLGTLWPANSTSTSITKLQIKLVEKITS